MELACLDGAVVPVAEARIPVTDEGLLRGDGVFEVIRLYDGRPFALADHLARMTRSAANLRLPFDAAAVEADARALLDAARPGDALLRLVVTRGGHRLALLEAPPGYPPPPRPNRAAAGLPADALAGLRRVRAHAGPRRRQVAVLRREHAREPPGQGARLRRGAARHAARARARGADVDVPRRARRPSGDAAAR